MDELAGRFSKTNIARRRGTGVLLTYSVESEPALSKRQLVSFKDFVGVVPGSIVDCDYFDVVIILPEDRIKALGNVVPGVVDRNDYRN